MTDKQHNPAGSEHLGASNDVPTGRSASSPFDQPTEKFPTSPGKSVPRTDDDFEPAATEQLPAYTPSDSPGAYSAVTPAVSPRYDTGSSSTIAEPVPVPPASSSSSSRKWNVDDDEPRGRGTLDLGLLILRLAVGGLFVFHGLMKLTGWWGGPGLDGMKDAMAQSGWEQPQWTAIMVTVGELAGGGLLILGLATPLAAGAVLAVIIDAWLMRQGAQPGLQFTAPNGPEYETLLLAGSAALILTGPGKIALDGGRGWATRPALGSLVCLVLAIAAAVCTWVFLHGGNPFV
ncbi:DoxX family protein [Antrihabitans cavernicola]|uniref:DoxX family protein n=1 Tax=Antrihabitans cavernicola TaxID=2495913 RepID=A0A5A7SHK9_9NOCA|nr:DoxX family protein [Spelaeibacter cavernicola]KAA0024217.1 DoxX family protein [Spelaeibacter cavernicola]